MKRKKCECGCGGMANPGSRFINGHNRRGKKHSLEARKKISRARKGRLASEETKKKLSEAGKGLVVSEETKKKISDTTTGKAWHKYHPYVAPYQYRRLQDAVKERDRYRCVLCDGEKRIATHHAVPIRIGYKSRLCDHESNMITLCNSCHCTVENNGNDKWKEFLPFAKKYLSQFRYEKLLLDDYL